MDVLLCRASTLTWSQSISPCLHSSAKPFSVSINLLILLQLNFSLIGVKLRNSEFFVLLIIPRRMDLAASEILLTFCRLLQASQMTVSVTGATDNHQVRVLTRSRSKAELIFPGKKTRFFPGVMIAEEPQWRDCIQGSTAVVNLAGTPIGTRWSSEIKKEIKESRIRVTSKVVDLINESPEGVRPSVLVSATALGYYGTSETEVFDESSPSGNDYLAEVCREWEGTALKVNKDVRLALIRIGIVLGKDGGALAKMIPLFMMFAGGPLGSGQQWFSWIHLDDIVNLIYEALSNPSYRGVINGTAPNPVRLAEMCDHLGNVLGRPSWLPVPEFALKAVLGEGAFVVLEGQRVVPARAKELGFPFKYRYVKDALKAIMS
ncbi:Epimerase family protein SDR39U1-like [Citrus sinensis]|uniref:Epimerase family protein SDR39U1-like n=2 Tax=Citrus sinensis TaxID=2711 RepID=A0ACB8IHX1_CITSI|nr:Epimerase family protein SDR39U1-like [Citrus sinensis]